MKFTLTKLEAEELQHKMGILLEEPDLQESYDLDEEDAMYLSGLFFAGAGAYEISDKYRDVMVGEFENLLDIAQCNHYHAKCTNDKDEVSNLASYIRKIKAAIKKIQTAQ